MTSLQQMILDANFVPNLGGMLHTLLIWISQHVALTLGTIALIYVIHQYLERMRMNCLGFFEWPFIGNLPIVLRVIAKDRWRMMAYFASDVFKGKTFQIKLPLKPRTFFILQPECVEHVLQTNFSNYIKGPIFHSFMEELLGDGIFNVDGEKWKRQRKLASPMFSAREFREKMEATFKNNMTYLHRELKSAIQNEATLDMHDLFHRFTLDSIGEIGFGVNVNSMENPNNPFANSFNEAQHLIKMRINDPIWKLKFYTDATTARLRSLVEVMDQYAYDIVRQRRADGTYRSKNDALSRFLRAETEDGEQAFNDKGLRDVVLNFLIAGRDTTAQALSWSVFLTAQHPEVEHKMREEIDEVLGEATYPTYDQTRKMTYVTAVVKESLRLYPSVPSNVKCAVNDDTLPDGTFVPAGCNVVYMPFAMGRSSMVWKNPTSFDPQRFVDEPKPSMFRYPVFQAGPRTCLGQHMAIFEATSVLASIYKYYHLRLVDKDSVDYLESLTLPMKSGLQVQVLPRPCEE